MAHYGIGVSGLFRDFINYYLKVPYHEAVRLSIKFDEELKGAEWLELYDGTTYTLTFKPRKGEKRIVF
jgi:hypothetical protein